MRGVHGAGRRRAGCACLPPVAEVGDRPVTTLEGLAPAGKLHPVQQAFLELGAMQCGYCTAGMIVAAAALLEADPDPDEAAIAAALDGNICRCCAYPRIVRAVRRAAELLPRAGRAGAALLPEPVFARPARPWDLVPAASATGLRCFRTASWSRSSPSRRRKLVDERGRLAPRRRRRGGDRLHRQGRRRPGQSDGALAARRRGAERAGRVGAAGDGRHRPVPVRRGHLRQPLDLDAGPLLREAAAAARRSLERRPLAGGERRIETPRRRRRLPGLQRERTPAPAGSEERRACMIVTGRPRYPTDQTRPGLLYGRTLRPPAAGASLRSVEVGRRRRTRGRDRGAGGLVRRRRRARPETAGRALRTIRAEWELPPQPSEDELAEHLRSHPVELEGWGGAFDHEAGDVQRAFAEAPIRLTRPTRPRTSRMCRWRRGRRSPTGRASG